MGYYLVDYRGELGAALRAHAAQSLTAEERVDLIGNASAMSEAGKLAGADALRLVEAFHDDSERDVVQRALGVALSYRLEMVPANLLPNYQRFLLKNFQARAKQLRWLPRAGESENDKLLRPQLVSAVARFGGDKDLADEARRLADRWLADHSAVPAEVTGAVLVTAATYGDLALYNRFFAALTNTQDTQAKQWLVSALTAFHDRAAIEASFRVTLEKKMPLSDGFLLLLNGRYYPDTQTMSFEFVKQHFDELMAGHPSVFGNDLGSYMPSTGSTFCDAGLREQYRAFFAPLVDKYPGRYTKFRPGAGGDRPLYCAKDGAGGERGKFPGRVLREV